MQIRLHAFEPFSRANGPGARAVVWFQGCTLGCPGCFNPNTHTVDAGHLADTSSLAADLIAVQATIEGISISGGEPFQQPDALLDVLQQLAGSGLSVLVFSGYTLAEIRQQTLGPAILPYIDILIAGRYAATLSHSTELLGSLNQHVHFLTPRYRPTDLSQVPPRELILHTDGTITATGISPWHPSDTAKTL